MSTVYNFNKLKLISTIQIIQSILVKQHNLKHKIELESFDNVIGNMVWFWQIKSLQNLNFIITTHTHRIFPLPPFFYCLLN
jgi:hypothetical protein